MKSPVIDASMKGDEEKPPHAVSLCCVYSGDMESESFKDACPEPGILRMWYGKGYVDIARDQINRNVLFIVAQDLMEHDDMESA